MVAAGGITETARTGAATLAGVVEIVIGIVLAGAATTATGGADMATGAGEGLLGAADDGVLFVVAFLVGLTGFMFSFAFSFGSILPRQANTEQ